MPDMPVIEIVHPGGPEQLRPARRPRPVPGKGEVLIEVAAAGVNRPDLLQRQGRYPPPPGTSDLPGLEVAGRIVDGDLDDGNPFGLARGDAVCALLAGGGYAACAVAPLAQCLPVPAGFSMIEAAALPENLFTVWSNVFERGQLGRGEGGAREILLVQGGSSGIGTIAIQLAAAQGHRVFATAGTTEKCATCERLGAERAINYHAQNFAEVVRQATDGYGADVILDMVAGDYVAREIDLLADGGRLVIIATLGGAEATVDVARLMRRRLTVTGSTLRARSIRFKGELAQRLHAHAWPLLEQGRVRPVIHQVFPAAQAARAHALMETSAHIGKLVLQW